MKSKLTIDLLRASLDYFPETGFLVWVKPQSNRVKVGDRAGVVARNGRRYINLGGEKHLAHRLAWFHYYGEWPLEDIKQVNGDYDDCRLENLITQTRQATATNRRVSANSKSGHPGVTWAEKRQKWQVHVTQNYKQVSFGYYDDLQEAIAAREVAQKSLVVESDADLRATAAHELGRRRRQRKAWGRLPADHAWSSFEGFCLDVGDVPSSTKALVAVDMTKPIGPGNFRWSLPSVHDFKTREGRIAYSRAHRAANPDLYRDKELRKSFGISLADYQCMFVAQKGVCAICEKPETTERAGEALWMAVDHNHDTGAMRGLLCTNCNVALGMFCDSQDILRKAIAYLNRHSGDSNVVRFEPAIVGGILGAGT